MRKRPLSAVCLVVILLLAGFGIWRDSGRNARLNLVQGYLAEAEQTGGVLEASGTVIACNAVSEGVRLTVDHISVNTNTNTNTNTNINSNMSVTPEFQLIMTTEDERLLPGDRIAFSGRYYAFEEAGNPGQFDAREYYFASGTVGSIRQPEITLIQKGGFGLARMLAALRRALRQSYLSILKERAARTISAISLGEKSWMESEWKRLYEEGGIAHIVSVSGLHISLIGMSLYHLLRRLRLSFLTAAVPAGAAVLAYALMSGFGVSAMRAGIMFLIWLGAQICGRKYDMLTSAGGAAVVILLTDAGNIRQSSFLLSFAAILALALLVPRIQQANPFREAQGKAGHMAALFWKTAGSSAGVWMGTLPVTLWFFYQTSPWSVLVNLAVIPLMSGLMAFGLLSCAAGLASVPVGVFLAAPVSYLLALFEWLCELEQRLPGAVWVAGRPAVWKLPVYYGILAVGAVALQRLQSSAVQSRQTAEGASAMLPRGHVMPVRLPRKACVGVRRYLAALIGTSACIFCVLLLMTRVRSKLTVIDLDVGQGDCALLMLPDGTNCLVDGGSSSQDSVWEYRISQTVKYNGIRTLDYVFLSHADSDHTDGIEAYFADWTAGFGGTNAHGITVKKLVLPPAADDADFAELKILAAEAGVPVLRMGEGAVIAGGRTDKAWSLACLAPSEDGLTGDKNEDSMVLMLRYGDFRMLFTGDLEGDAEKALAASGADLRCNVLKVGHHGSAGASSEEFLAAVRPDFGVISCGKNNIYGHPAPAAVARLQSAGVSLLTTADVGAVIVHSDGEIYTIEAFRG